MSMTTTEAARRTLNDWVLRTPESLGLFRELGLDTCCGGERPLEEVCRLHELDLQTVLERLDRLG